MGADHPLAAASKSSWGDSDYFCSIFSTIAVASGTILQGAANPQVAYWARSITAFMTPNGLAYNLIYFGLVVGFTYFYTAVVFNPQKIADEIKNTVGLCRGLDREKLQLII